MDIQQNANISNIKSITQHTIFTQVMTRFTHLKKVGKKYTLIYARSLPPERCLLIFINEQ